MADEVTNSAGIADAGQAQEQTQGQVSNAGSQAVESNTQRAMDGVGIADPTPSPSNTGIADNKASMAEQSKAQEAPVYEYELKANEGEDLGFFNNLCKTAKLSKQQADIMLDGLRSQNKLDIENSQKEQTAQAREMLNNWYADTNRDADFGGKAWTTTCHNANKCFDAFDETDPYYVQKYGTVRDLLQKSGYQHHPLVIRMMARAGASMGEDKFIGSNGKQGSEELSLAERMYPGMK